MSRPLFIHDLSGSHSAVHPSGACLQAARSFLCRGLACIAFRGDRSRATGGNQAVPFCFRDEARTAVILASGPSLTVADAERCRGWPTIAVNDCYRIAPWADAIYACDADWWDLHRSRIADTGCAGQLWTQARKAAQKHDLNWMPGHSKPGLSREPNVLHFGSSSGYQAMNLAYHWGSRHMVLLGFDVKPTKDRHHWFGNHPGALRRALPYAKWISAFGELARDLKAAGIDVANCSRDTALTCFRRSTLDVELCAPAA